jgi:pimeloyl-ACP methyl ester carboxylesterase
VACSSNTACPSDRTSRFPFVAAFEWLIAQDGVDPETVAVIGRSFGGYLGPCAAAFEPRVAALVADPGQYDFASRVGLFAKGLGAKGLGSGTPEDFLARLTASDPDLDAQLQGAVDGPRNLEWYGSRMAAMAATRVGDFIRKQLTFTLEDVASDIRCPTLLTEGEGDFASQNGLLYDHLHCEKHLKRFTEAEGGGGHCEGFGATLFEGYVFDWLDEVLAKGSADSQAPTAAK